MDCYERAGMPKSDAAPAGAFVNTYRQLSSVTDNQVLLLYRDHVPEADVIDYGMRYSLTTQDDEARLLRFLRDPLSRSYSYNYTLGRQLIAAFLNRSKDQRHAFQQLISEPLTPSQIHELVTAAN
jgi:hypothetical protein